MLRYHGRMIDNRDPDTGRFVTQARWEAIQEIRMEEFEDWEDLEYWDSFDEREVY